MVVIVPLACLVLTAVFVRRRRGVACAPFGPVA